MDADAILASIRKRLNWQLKAGESYRRIESGTGVSRQTLHDLAHGRAFYPRIDTVAALVNYLGVEVEVES